MGASSQWASSLCRRLGAGGGSSADRRLRPGCGPCRLHNSLRAPHGRTSGSLRPQDALSATTPSAAAGPRPRCGSGLWWECRTWLGVGVGRWGGGAVRDAAGGGSVGSQWGRRRPQAALAGRRAAGLVRGGRGVAHARRCPDFSAGFLGGHGTSTGQGQGGGRGVRRGSAPDPRGAEGRGSQC